MLTTVIRRGAPPALSSSSEPRGGFFGARDDMIDHLSFDTKCRNQQKSNATPNHSILSHGCKEEDEQGFDGDERRGADSSCVLANLFTGLDKVQRRSTRATYRTENYPPCPPIHWDPQDSLSHT
jgi:hypothetical protein